MIQRAALAQRIKDDPKMVKQLEDALGKEQAAELIKADPAQVEAEAEKLFKDLAENYVGGMKPERLTILFQNLRFSPGKAGQTLLQTLIEKDARPEVKGTATLALGQMLKQQADDKVDADPKSAEAIRQKAEALFETAVEKYADIKAGFRGTVGSVAKRELFDIRNLSVGKSAPEVEGEDQDGQKFKLADYKGKVVLLDFWSEF
jgi:hypothetical protein